MAISVSKEIANLFRRNHSRVLRSMAEVKQNRVAALVEISESVLTEWKNSHLERACAVISACGLKVVASSARTYPDDWISSLQKLAARGVYADPDDIDEVDEE